ncbi:MAG: hypothetical protein ACOC7V_09885 [Spirochaetota bacterium]
MKRRSVMIVLLVLAAAALAAQEPYPEGLLDRLGLEGEEIERVREIQRQSATDLRVKRAELEVRKAELARLLVEDDPSMRAIERNLRETADVEVEVRKLEIERELAIREIVGTDRWTRITGALLARRTAEARADVARSQLAGTVRDRLRMLEQTIERRQEDVRRALESREEMEENEDIRRQFELLREEYRELQELIRERL